MVALPYALVNLQHPTDPLPSSPIKIYLKVHQSIVPLTYTPCNWSLNLYSVNRSLTVYTNQLIPYTPVNSLKDINWFIIETDKRVAPPIPFVYWLGLQNLRRHMCCRAIKTKRIGVTVIIYQSLYPPIICQSIDPLYTSQLILYPNRYTIHLIPYPIHQSIDPFTYIQSTDPLPSF